MTSESQALTVEDLIAALERQNNPQLKLKVGTRWVTRIKYRNVAGKPFIEPVTNDE